MSKVLVQIYYSYGKGEGQELGEQYAMEDTKENREEIFEDLNISDLWNEKGKQEFIQGKINDFYWDICDDWDSPTGCEVFITTYEEEKEKIEKEYKKKFEELENLFRGE